MVNIVVVIAIIAIAVLGTFIMDRILFHPGRLRVWRSWFKHYYIALRDIRHLMLGCKEPPPLQTTKDLLVEINKLRADALARIGDRDLRKALCQQYLLTWQACDRWVIYHQVMSENP